MKKFVIISAMAMLLSIGGVAMAQTNPQLPHGAQVDRPNSPGEWKKFENVFKFQSGSQRFFPYPAC